MKKILLVFAVLTGFAAAAAADVPLSRLGPEIRVNSTTQGSQASPAVAGGALGSFVAVWLGPDGSGGQQVFGQRFDALGARQGGEIRISSAGNVTVQPRVAASPDGGFVAAWISGGVQVRFYGPDGAPRGEAARVDVPATQVQDADVAVDGAGEAMVVWTTGGPHGRILARRFDLLGQPRAEPFAVRADRDLSSSEVRVAAAPDGDFLAVWSEKGTGTGDALWMRRFDVASRTWGPEVRATPMDGALHYEPLAAFRPDGSFFLAWTQIIPVFYPSISNTEAWVRDFQGDGAPEGDGRSLFTFLSGPEVSLAVGRDGNVLMVVTGTEHELDGILYDSSWHPLSPPLKIHADVLAPEVQPAVAAAGGSFVAVWTRGIDDPFVPAPAWTDGSSSGIFGQRLGSATPAGAEFQVNVVTQGVQLFPDVAEDAGGNFAVVWADESAPPSSLIKVRLFAASGAPTSGEILVAQTQPSSSTPRVAMTPLGEFVVVWEAGQNIFLRHYDRLGRTPQIVFDPLPPGTRHNPDVVVDTAGNAVVVWAESHPDGDLIVLQRYGANGFAVGLPQQVNQNAPGTRDHPRIAISPAGSLLVSWDDNRAGLSDVWARRFDGPAGAWSPETRINPDGAGYQQGSAPLLYPQEDGAVVFYDLTASKLLVRRLDATGAVAGDPIPLGDAGPDFQAPDASLAPDGTAFVVWQGADRHIHGGFFDRSWSPRGESFPVSPPVAQLMDLGPAAASGPAGSIAVWANGAVPPPFPGVPFGDGLDGSAFGIFARRFPAAGCAAGAEVLCLGAGNRFEARVSWRNPYNGDTGTGKAVPLTGDTGAFWFFSADNLELMIKVLDGRAINGSFWVFYGSLSNVEYTVTVTDTTTGTVKTYHNAPLQLASRADVDAFPAPASLAAGAAKAAPVPPFHPAFAAGTCDPSQGLCLAGDRFQARVDFIDPRTGLAGKGQAVPLTGDTGAFWFFDPTNLELMIKVLDGRAINGEFWVFYGGLSDVEYTITVTDEATGAKRTYHNARHHLASGADTAAFPAGGGD
jgi:hypothetical protein